MPDLSLYKVDLDTPQPDGPNGEKRRGESPRAAFTKYNEALEEIEGGFVPAEAGKGLSTNDYDDTAQEAVNGMGTAASRNVASIGAPNTSDLMPVGFAGIGTYSSAIVDFNDPSLYLTPNVSAFNIRYTSAFNPANKPPSASNWWFMKVEGLLTGSNVWSYSILAEDINGNKFTRTVSKNSSTGVINFGRWVLLYSQTNAIAPVSQSGGVPTGGLMQYGATPNGYFFRYANGMQICTREISTLERSIAGVVVPYPANFLAGTVRGSITFGDSSPEGRSAIRESQFLSYVVDSGWVYSAASNDSALSVNRTTAIAIGRYF